MQRDGSSARREAAVSRPSCCLLQPVQCPLPSLNVDWGSVCALQLLRGVQGAWPSSGPYDHWALAYPPHTGLTLQQPGAVVQVVMPPPSNSFVGTLTPSVMVSGGGVFGVTGSWGRALMNGFSALYKRGSRRSSCPFLPCRYTGSLQPRRGPSPQHYRASAFILDFQPPGLWEINVYDLYAAQVVICVVVARTGLDTSDKSHLHAYLGSVWM